MKQYLDLLKDVLENGMERNDRTGVGTISVFGRQLRFKMSDGFPIITTKRVFFPAVTSELLWFLEGSTNEHRLAEIKNDNKPYDQLTEKERSTIWTLNAENQGKSLGYTDGELGPIYGMQWRCFNFVDQMEKVINGIKTNPTDRRLLVSAWNVGELAEMALPPCHYAFQFYVSGKNNEFLSLMWNQRSVDTFLGLPFNIASYALLLNIIAKMANKIPYELIGNLGDTHIYKNHLEQVNKQLERTPHKLPSLKMPNIDWSKNLNSVLTQLKTSDFVLENYIHDGALAAPMAV